MTALEDGQYSFRDLTFGLGTDYPLDLAMIDGLEGSTVNVGDRTLPRGHGSVPGKHYEASRQMLATFVLARNTRDDLELAQRVLADAFKVSEDDQYALEYKKQGQPQRLVWCRATAFARGDTRVGLSASPKVSLLAADPRIYSSEEHTDLLPLYAAAGGSIDLPTELPFDLPAGVALEAAVVNAGNADAPVMLRVYGPSSGTLTGWTLQNQSTGASVTVTADIASGQVMTYDSRAYITGSGDLVVSLDGASRYGDWEQPRVPFVLPPGESVLRFTATGTATVVPAALTWRDTDLS